MFKLVLLFAIVFACSVQAMNLHERIEAARKSPSAQAMTLPVFAPQFMVNFTFLRYTSTDYLIKGNLLLDSVNNRMVYNFIEASSDFTFKYNDYYLCYKMDLVYLFSEDGRPPTCERVENFKCEISTWGVYPGAVYLGTVNNTIQEWAISYGSAAYAWEVNTYPNGTQTPAGFYVYAASVFPPYYEIQSGIKLSNYMAMKWGVNETVFVPPQSCRVDTAPQSPFHPTPQSKAFMPFNYDKRREELTANK